MKEEKLHHGQCQQLLIVRSGNCMEEPATEYTPAMHTRDGQGSNYYMYGWGCNCMEWGLVTCSSGRGRMVNKRPWAATPRKGHQRSSILLLSFFPLLQWIMAITKGKGIVYKMMIAMSNCSSHHCWTSWTRYTCPKSVSCPDRRVCVLCPVTLAHLPCQH